MTPSLTTTVKGGVVKFNCLLSSLLVSNNTSKSQPLPLTMERTLFTVLASSIETAKNFTPVSSTQSSRNSLIAVNTNIHGPHQVAQKDKATGASPLESSLMSTLLPFKS